MAIGAGSRDFHRDRWVHMTIPFFAGFFYGNRSYKKLKKSFKNRKTHNQSPDGYRGWFEPVGP
jgi:hypothetical protein